MSFERGPYLSVAAFCENVIEDKTGVLSLIRIVDKVVITGKGTQVPEDMPPGEIVWNLVLVLKGGDVRGSHPLRVQPVLPSGENVNPMTITVHLDGANRGPNVVIPMRLPVKMPGIYWTKIYFNDELMTQLPIEVVYSRIQAS